ncbi:DNA cytosine methyltransferase [Pseudomonas sp. QL9]|uniref:DNA cytosine methyltransferase n=1 Tax=Pseudomonas sp. QL9 TaxID=3242725 RepID=UPI00352A8A48
MKAAYYNENEAYAAQHLRNLIAAGHIAPGDVDERSIEDVHPDDLRPYTQCHFFAGVGVWSYALRRAGWPDSRPVWTGSCPCQPFSSAGEGAGFDDPRHLWPAFAWLIRERRPGELLGEQVASKDAEPWLDLVQADLEAMGYAFGAVAFPSAGVGAPHIRDRAYWVANTNSKRQGSAGNASRTRNSRRLLEAGRLDDAYVPRLAGHRRGETQSRGPEHRIWTASGPVGEAGSTRGLADANGNGCDQAGQRLTSCGLYGLERDGLDASGQPAAGPVNGLWRDADWLLCRDGKWRPVEPGTFPLVDGATARVGRLRAYGNALNAEAATQFVGAYMEAA